MTVKRLNVSEEALVDAARRGRPIDLEMKGPAIRGELIRNLLLDLVPEILSLTNVGLVIRRARISGHIDLDHAAGPGGAALPTLVLEDCMLSGRLSARHAHLGRLSLARTVFSSASTAAATLDLEGCQASADMCLNHMRPATDKDLLWVNAADLRIDGSLSICGAVLRAPPKKSGRRVHERRRNGLLLKGADILGEVNALGGLAVDGGVNLAECHIRGSVWLGGAVLRGCGHNALNAQSSVIDGNLMLSPFPHRDDDLVAPPFKATGCVWLMGARIGGSLGLDEVQIDRGSDPDGALVLSNLVAGDVRAVSPVDRPARLKGGLIGFHINVGNLEIAALCIGCDGGPNILGGIALDHSIVERRLLLSDIRRLNRDVDVIAELSEGRTPTKSQPLPSYLSLNEAVAGEVVIGGAFGGPLEARSLMVKRNASMEVSVRDRLVLPDGDIQGNFRIWRATFEGGGHLDMSGVRVGQTLSLERLETGARPNVSEPFGSDQASRMDVNLTGARAETLSMRHMRVTGIEAARLRVEKDMGLAVSVQGRANFLNASVGGSLDLRDFRFAESGGRNLVLKDASVGLALKVSNALRTDQDDGPRQRPVDVREAPLACYPGWRVVEALWRDLPGVPQGRTAQSRHLVSNKGEIRTFTGESLIIHQLNAQKKPSLNTAAEVEEYARLFCASVHGEDGGFPFLDGPENLPEGLTLDWSGTNAAVEKLRGEIAELESQGAASAEDEIKRRRAEIDRKSTLMATYDLKGLKPERFAVQIRREGSDHRLEATILYGRAAFRSKFTIRPTGMVDMDSDEPVTPDLVGPLPTFSGKLVIREEAGEGWALPPVVKTMKPLKGRRRKELEARLLAEVLGLALGSAEVDLEDLSCGTLEDDGGRAWGFGVRVKLDRLTYGQAVGAISGPAEIKRDDSGARAILDLKNAWRAVLARGRRSWEHRRDWLYMQFDGHEARRRPWGGHIDRSAYKPQPFAQIIRVARAMGDERAAVEFEILKHRIEARHWNLESLRAFAALGVFVVAAALLVPPLLNLAPWSFGADRVVPSVVAGALVAISPFALNTLFRWMFGYLRRPLNALATILCFFTLGWIGTHAANRNERLVIDMTPVASAAAEADDKAVILLGPPLSEGRVEGSVHCGDQINEALFALDVFIPLIDLRQESRCEVGTPSRPRPAATDARRAEAGLSGASWLDGLFRSVAFWDWAKAIYAVAGWLVISLSILTFANVARRREEGI